MQIINNIYILYIIKTAIFIKNDKMKFKLIFQTVQKKWMFLKTRLTRNLLGKDSEIWCDWAYKRTHTLTDHLEH